MKTVNTHEAKTHFSRLLKRVALGEQIIIASRGTAVARLVPIEEKDSRRGLGFSGANSWCQLTLTPRCQKTFYLFPRIRANEPARKSELPGGYKRRVVDGHRGSSIESPRKEDSFQFRVVTIFFFGLRVGNCHQIFLRRFASPFEA